MKRTINILIAFLVFLITSCNQDFLETPELEVSIVKSSWSVGEEITFEFTGNPQFITFYSGEDGNDYDAYLNGSVSDRGQAVSGFDTRVENYTYSYSVAGTYKATFIASSNNVEGIKEKVIQIELTITE